MMVDVRCENCQTEYELEGERVPPAGLSVKCSTCGQVFMVHPDTAAAWKLRQTNGVTIEFKELTTLQRWIVEKKVSSDDEISKTGNRWKRLGDIEELQSFFRAVDHSVNAPPPGCAGTNSTSRSQPQRQRNMGGRGFRAGDAR